MVRDSAPKAKQGIAIGIVETMLITLFPIVAIGFSRLLTTYDPALFWRLILFVIGVGGFFWFFSVAGAEKVNINTAAVKQKKLISNMARAIGTQSTVLSMDIRRVSRTAEIPSGYEIVINGGITSTGIDALEWAKTGEELGAGELVINSIDADGTKDGYEIQLTRMIADSVGIPVIASGGAGKPEHLYEVITEGHADAALVASVVHYGEYTCRDLKEYLHNRGVKVRMNY